jgi:tetratricopeptide (TPR) repeat protein
MSNGASVPAGIVIERVCQGRTTREAYADSTGLFGFQLGANNIFPDASNSDPSPRLEAPGRTTGFLSGPETRNLIAYADCNLRAQLGGYRSSLIDLNVRLIMGQMDVGTIVLYPTAAISGTTVSVTEILAPKKAKKALERADKAIRSRDWEHAQEHLQTALQNFPQYAAAWLRLGQVCRAMCRIEEARHAFTRAIEADLKYVPPYIELARLAAMERGWEETVDLTDHALQLDPLDFPVGFYLNAVGNINLGRLDAAERSARRAQRLDGRHQMPQTHLLLASILHRRRDLAGEIEQLHDYLKFAPQSGDTKQVRSRLQVLEARIR